MFHQNEMQELQEMQLPGHINRLPETRWSLVLRAVTPWHPTGATALRELCEQYRQPLLEYLRAAGIASQSEEDVLHNFIVGLLESQTLQGAIGARSFRAYLLAALRNFALNQRRLDRAQKRGGDIVHLPFTDTEHTLHLTLTPEDQYIHKWKISVLKNAMRLLRSSYEVRGKKELFEALKVSLSGRMGHGEYRAIAQRLAMTEQQVGGEIYRLRTGYRKSIEKTIADTVTSAEDVSHELEFLFGWSS